jgi:TPR repeat protein
VVPADDCRQDHDQAVVRDRKSEHLWHLSQRNNAAGEVPRQNGLILSLVVLKLSLTLAPSLARVCKAADQGQATAQAYLGAMYTKGEGVPQDYTQAVVWYRKAADQ